MLYLQMGYGTAQQHIVPLKALWSSNAYSADPFGNGSYIINE